MRGQSAGWDDVVTVVGGIGVLLGMFGVCYTIVLKLLRHRMQQQCPHTRFVLERNALSPYSPGTGFVACFIHTLKACSPAEFEISEDVAECSLCGDKNVSIGDLRRRTRRLMAVSDNDTKPEFEFVIRQYSKTVRRRRRLDMWALLLPRRLWDR